MAQFKQVSLPVYTLLKILAYVVDYPFRHLVVAYICILVVLK